MKYSLSTVDTSATLSTIGVIKKFWDMVRNEKKQLLIALFAILINSGLVLIGPFLIGYAINHYVIIGNYRGVLFVSLALVGVYIGAFIFNYIQIVTMGGVGQRVLFRIRNMLFQKLQELPVAFFNQNKAGDLISRINNDTDKLNQFFSQGIMQFIGNIFVVLGAGIFLIILQPTLGLLVLLPAIVLFVVTNLISNWIKKRNHAMLQSTGAMSAEIQESLGNFKVVVAFDRRDYFKNKFNEINNQNYKIASRAGISNTILTPIFDTAGNVAQIIFLVYGVYLISTGQLTAGFFVSFLVYINRFYDPLRQMSALWSSFQTALAGWDRVSEILSLESDLPVIASEKIETAELVRFENVGFGYVEGNAVLDNISITLERGKTYAFVGPTGGGKTTTASLMARLYDPTSGIIIMDGRDLRSFTSSELADTIGFILQEPYMFTGTVRDNIVYGNAQYEHTTDDELIAVLKEHNLEELLSRFPGGLSAPVSTGSEGLSLGQRQLIAFMRVLLRKPKLLILDEATANIDTVTEQLLDEILHKLPKETTKVIIAHRLNTIAEADEIFFVNGGHVTPAGSLEHAVEMLMHGKRKS